MKDKSFLLGVGFDAGDGHKRITKGENFYILGGCKSTHKFMQEGCVKFNEELKKRHKVIEELSLKEFHEITNKIGLNTLSKKDSEG